MILASFRHATRTVLGREIHDDVLLARVGAGNLIEQMSDFDPEQAEELANQAWARADELDGVGRGALAAILAQLHNMQGDGSGAAEWADRALAEELPPDIADMTAAGGRQRNLPRDVHQQAFGIAWSPAQKP